ncbi:MAG: PP2C family protein-serine/threonine phosphatase [Fibrobacter sp.]|nr:PP2C family protein-serine/threonine phosphatase [Fibrobacter sp.]
MRKRIHFFKDWKLVWQMSFLFIVFMTVSCIVNTGIVYTKTKNLFLKERSENFMNLANFTALIMEQDKNIDWLLAYWENHYGDMKIVYDNPAAADSAYHEFFQKNPNIDTRNLTNAILDSLPPEAQLNFAEYKYMKWLDNFNTLMREYKPLYLSAYAVRENADQFFYISAITRNGSRDTGAFDAFKLGTTYTSKNGSHPVRKKTWDTGLATGEIESIENGYYHVYSPVVVSGKTVCLIAVTLETKTVNKELHRKSVYVQNRSIIGFVICGILILLVLYVAVNKPINNLYEAIIQYHKDKDHVAAAKRLKKYFGKNEMGLLSRSFASLALEMDIHTKSIAQLAIEKEKIGTELTIATKIQNSILPRIFPPFPDRGEFDIFANMQPAKEVGGDFYDFFMVDNDHLALVIADVSGKGVPAALFMMAAKTVIKAQVMAGNSAASTLTATNNTFAASNEAEMFVSVWLGIYEISTGIMRCSNAGHEYPAIKKANEHFKLYKDKHGFVVGGLPNIQYSEYELKLSKGDTLFVYTDGVTEANNAQHELFGTNRMLDALNSAESDSPTSVLQRVNEGIKDFVKDAEQFDDITMLAFRVN